MRKSRHSEASGSAASLCLLATLLVAVVPAPLWAGDWYVDDDGDCVNGNGSNGDPFCLIQDAIGAAFDGDTIHIAAGTYFENLKVDKDLSLIGTEGGAVTLVDGTRSGSVMTVGPNRTVTVDGITFQNGQAARGGGLFLDEGAMVTLSNTTVSGNLATGTLDSIYDGDEYDTYYYAEADGAGIFHPSGSLVLESSTVSGNTIGANGSPGNLFCTDGNGAGLHSGGLLSLANCTVSGNRGADLSHGYGYVENGGGIFASAPVTMTDSTLALNRAERGGGIHSEYRLFALRCQIESNYYEGISSAGRLEVHASTFTDNVIGLSATGDLFVSGCEVRGNYQGIYFWGDNALISETRIEQNSGCYAAGIWIRAESATVRGCEIVDNFAYDGGAGIVNSGNLILETTLIAGNRSCAACADCSPSYGAGISNGLSSRSGSFPGDLLVRSSAIVGNSYEYFGGGGIGNQLGRVILENSVIAGNSALWAGGLLNSEEASALVLGHTIVAGNSAEDWPDCEGGITSKGYNLIGDTSGCAIEGDETGNLYDIDALFVDPDGPDDDPSTWQDNDWSLHPSSPCVDAGNPEIWPHGQDLAGNPRLLDGDLDHSMIVDMGAFEFSNVHLDITGDATAGGTLTITTTGKPNLLALLFFSVQPGEQLLYPYGSLFVGAPFQFFPLAIIPDSQDIKLPGGAPVGMEIWVQELAVDVFSAAGNFSNPIRIGIQ